ncbi:hexose transporter protein [Cryptococcus neoformans Bt120]|nr:hexose transporter protein [Cryptococcus neoformans var. grubii Bt120]
MAPGHSVSSKFAFAQYQNNAHPQWWKDPGMRRGNLVILLYMVAQATGGYDKSLINNLQSIPTWEAVVGHPTGSALGVVTAMLSIGVIVGSPFFGWLSDWKGRKITMFIGSCIMLVGAILQAAATNRDFFIGGRFLIGFGVAGTLCSGPLLASEIAHPRQRSVVASFYNTFWYVGSIICAWLSFGTAYLSNDWAWRIPCIGQAVPALILVCIGLWLPESPRYLVKKNRSDEALAILARYHANGDQSDPLVQFELQEIKQTLDAEAMYETKGWIKPWLDLVSTRPNRYRMFIITIMVIGIDWCGTSITSYYLSTILSSVGITSATQQTGINGGLQVFNWLTSVSGAMLVERLGRRALWLTSFGGMLAVNVPFGACSALYAKRGDLAAGRAVVALVFLYNGFYNIGCNPLPYAYAVEILPYNIRAKGLAFEVAFDASQGVLGQWTNPIAMDALEWKFYFVYTAFLVLIVLAVYFTFPETKGLTLEEIKEVFGDGDSVNPAIPDDYDPAEAKNDDAKVDIKDVPVPVTR